MIREIWVDVTAWSHIIDYTGKGGFVPPVLEVSVLKSSHKLRSNPQIQQHRALFLGGYRVSLIGRFHRQLAAGWDECTVAGPVDGPAVTPHSPLRNLRLL